MTKNLEQIGSGQGTVQVSPRKLVVQSSCQYDVTSRVSDFQNGLQSVYRRDGWANLTPYSGVVLLGSYFTTLKQRLRLQINWRQKRALFSV